MTNAIRHEKRSARLASRCTLEQKATVQRAAALCGSSVTDFTINALMEKANHIIMEHHIITLSLNDQIAFADALLNPPKPNKALSNAKYTHQKMLRS